MSTTTAPADLLGAPLDRLDGHLKVTGAAKYAVEMNPPKVLHAWPVLSAISNGKIKSIDTADAEKAPGVRAVFTHLNVPKFKEVKADPDHRGGIRIEERMPLKDDVISYGGQYVALVVAATLEQAAFAASLVKAAYDEQKPALTWQDAADTATNVKGGKGEEEEVSIGEPEKAFADPGLVNVNNVYITPVETHNPMETCGTIAVWDAEDRLTLHDATQYVKGVQDVLAQTFGLPRDNVRVICPYVGGAFGCKGPVWMHVILAAMAAKAVGAPVKFALTRQAMFSGAGHRPPTRQTVALAATHDGKLRAMSHHTETATSHVGEYKESCGPHSTGVLYATPAIAMKYTLYKTHAASPSFMRAPGECEGTYALECAMDELAWALKMDPVKLRDINYADAHPVKNKPWSSKHLREAYRLGAEKFGWAGRTPEPRSMKDGDLLVGWGVASATFPGYKMSSAARARIKADGSAEVQCATHDLGTGALTAFTQISAEALGVPVEKVKFGLGDSALPYGPVAGGSSSTGSVGTALYDVAKAVHRSLAAIAINDKKSPLAGMKLDDIALVAPGKLGSKTDPSKTDSFAGILKRAGKDFVEAEIKPTTVPKDSPVEFQSFGAQFCEVKIDPLLPRVRVTRVVSVMDCGRIINAKTASSQIMGGVVMGIGMALHEECVYDPQTGLPVTRNLADYRVPVNADIISIEPFFVGEPDYAYSPMGARGLGEIGITGIVAAVANAVFHATGKRVRDLPITPDKLMDIA